MEKMGLSSNQNRDGTETAAGISGKQDAAKVGKRQWSALALHMEFKGEDWRKPLVKVKALHSLSH